MLLCDTCERAYASTHSVEEPEGKGGDEFPKQISCALEVFRNLDSLHSLQSFSCFHLSNIYTPPRIHQTC